MTDPADERPVPRGLPLAIGLALLLAVILIAAYRWSGLPLDQAALAPVAASRDLRFVTLQPSGISDQGVEVYDAATGVLIQTLPPGEEGFIRGLLRSIGRDRRSRGLPETTPFRLARRTDGIFTLEDLGTGLTIDLRAFGATNSAAFARFMPPHDRPSAAPD